LAHRFNHRGEPLEDLEQVASLGLIKAIDGFRTGEGVAFAAYAHPTILGELRRHFRDKGWMVRVPRSLQERRSEINTAARELSQTLGRTPTTADIADCLKLSKEQVLLGVQAAQAYSATSLERPFGDDGVTLGDGLVSEEDAFELVETRELLRSVLPSLPDRERRILGLRYFRQLSQSEIAKELGISQMHVSRLLRRALDSLRVELVAA
jgi:RNA polymerase sigma-B factor